MADMLLPSVHPSEPLDLANTTIPQVYRQLGSKYPDRLFARLMKGDEDDTPLQNITWGQLLSDAQHISQHLAPQLIVYDYTRPLIPEKVIGLLAGSGHRYYTFLVALWLLGWTPLLLSARNSTEAIEHLLRVGGASALITDKLHRETGIKMQDAIDGLILLEMDSKSESKQVDHVAASSEESGTDESDLDCVAFYTHTSGSQGHPKLIPTSHRRFVAGIQARTAVNYAGSPVYAPLPLFHGMGLYAFTRWPIGSGVVPTFVTMNGPLNGQALLRHLKRLPGAITFLAPSVLEEIANSPQSDLTSLLSVKRVFYGGAPMSPQAARTLVTKGVSLANSYGSSETSLLSVLDLPSDDILADWSYIRFQPDHYTLHLLPVDDSLVRELIVSPSSKDSPAVLNHSNPVGFSSNDLWMPHPTKAGLWKHMGRKDDVTVLSNGEKTDNKQIESLLLQDSRIMHAVVFGAGKPFNGVILSPDPSLASNTTDREGFLDSIWKTIDHVNTIIPRHSRLLRQMVIIADAERPFMLTDKGTVRTKETIQIYVKDIETAYKSLEGNSSTVPEERHDLQSHSDLLEVVRCVVHEVAQRTLMDDDNVFDCGLDSLHAFQIRLGLLTSPQLHIPSLPYNIVYMHPTISRISAFLNDSLTIATYSPQLTQDKALRIGSSLEKFTNGLPQLSRQVADVDDHSGGHTVAISGATGSLGCYSLRELLLRSDIKKVYSFHRGRPEMALERQMQSFVDRGISIDLLVQQRSKLEFLQVDLSSPILGLSQDALTELRSQLTHIIHVAWHLNFNLTLESFEREHVAGVRHLIDLTLSSTRSTPSQLVFISSIGAVSHFSESLSVPEREFRDHSLPGNQGYAEAKYVAERIIDEACHRSGLNATVIRAGQLSGSTVNGFWTPSEHIPILFTSSHKLKLVPSEFPDTRWLPTDVASRAVVRLSLRRQTSSPVYYHVENPTATSWTDVLKLYTNTMVEPIQAVSMQDWLAAVEQAGSAGLAAMDIPAVQLMQFYANHAAARSSWVNLDVTESLRICPELDCGPVTQNLLRKYITWLSQR